MLVKGPPVQLPSGAPGAQEMKEGHVHGRPYSVMLGFRFFASVINHHS